ncbi:hypothetical protein L6452_12413 [Arctium lappa]|uniref:Uncharacterized protein n=1 Tax=Arctium lappa TaxID=4217 RepID=A0ACB9DR63_ARCLA|nr:hypothetical protein L6452_12413 [Arctium lappa]
MSSSCYLCLLLLLMSFFHFCLSTQNYNHVLCKDVERQALLQFKQGLIDPANRLASWMGEEKECCSWAGIACDNFTGHVDQIRLRGRDGHCYLRYYNIDEGDEEVSKQMLGGDLSPSLLQLQQLVHLDLSCNDFGGIQVPRFMGSLKNLRYLNLSSSNFGGIIPPQLGNLSKLEVLDLGKSYDDAFDMEWTRNMQWLSSLRLLHYLDMSGRDLSETFDWFQVINTLPSLAELHLSDCQLSHAHPHVSTLNITSLSLLDLSRNEFHNSFVPRWIFGITTLVSLDLSGCNFQGAIPSGIDVFRNLTSLELLHVSRSNFMNSSLVLKGLSSSIGSNLISLGLGSCDVSSSQLVALHNLTSLLSLDLSENQFTTAIPKSLGNLCNLREIDLSFNNFQNNSLAYLLESFFECKSPSLESLILRYSGLPGHLPDQLGQLVHLVHLDLAGNNIIGIIPDWTGGLSLLEMLDLSNNRLNGSLPASLGQLSKLYQLDLSFNQLNGNFPDSLCHLLKLYRLDLSYNKLNGSLPDCLGHLSKLYQLDLSINQLNGNFPDGLCHLSKLYELDLSYNRLNGNLPDCLGRLSKLYQLRLFNNQLNGNFPDSLCHLSKLYLLDLSYNQLTGNLPDCLGHLSKLHQLYLSNNQLTGNLPDSLGHLTKLDQLYLSNNQLNGSLPGCLGQLLNLERLDLSYNQLNGGLPHIHGQLSKLYYLDLSSNLLTGVVTEAHFANLTGLKYLNGTGNNLIFRPQLANWIPPFQLYSLYLNSWVLGPKFPMWLLSQKDLTDLDISNTNISAPLPPLFWRIFPHLRYLDMSQNHIQGTLFSVPATLDTLTLSSNNFTGQLPDLSKSSSLRDLDLSYNFFAGSLHDLFCPYDGRRIVLLNLGNNHLTGVVPECWVNWPLLAIINLENNNLSGEIPRTLGFLPQLNSLNMRGNKLTGRLPASLMNLTGLVLLQLGRNELVGSIPTWLGRELRSLRSLDLRSNNFDGNIPQELCYLTKIHILDLAHNNLSGNIPRCFNNFTALSGRESDQVVSYDFHSNRSNPYLVSESLVMKGREDIYNSILGLVMMIDLSSNNFVGHIPSELTVLRELKSLNLSRNQLTGRIPEKIGNMKSLESLDISLNNLSGELPTSLSSLSFLSNFNVSNNNFTGRIPSSTQLQSFDESSFLGNNLCGDPLIKPCVVAVPYRDQEENDGSHGTGNWGLIISMVLGFVVGFWMIVGPLIVSRSWRIAYFRFLMRVGYMSYDVIHKCCCNQ